MAFRHWTTSAALLLAIVPLAGCSRALLDERFFDNRLTGWTVLDDPETIEGPSKWQVESDGWLHQRSNIWGRRGDFIGRWYGTYLVAGDSGWRNYELSVKAKPNDDDGLGVVFRFQDPEHFYRLILVEDGMSGGPIARLDKREGADYTELWSSNEGFRRGTEFVLRIRVHKDSISAMIGDHLLCEVEDGSYEAGKIGLFCYAQKDQAFDDVRVTGY